MTTSAQSMLTRDGCLARRERLWNSLPRACEWVLLGDPRHVHYFSNFWVNPISFSTSERGLLLLERAGTATLLADNMTRRSAVDVPCVDRELIAAWYDHRHSVINRDDALFGQLKEIRPDLQGRQGAVEAEWLPVRAFQELELEPDILTFDLGSLIRQLRRQKHADELALLERCMRACEAGHRRALEIVRPGLSDLDVYCEVQNAVTSAAGLPCIVYGDFRSVNAATPKRGGLPQQEPLRESDLLILDFSVMIGGYRSDFTNTLAVGEPSAAQREIFEICKAALFSAEATLGGGASAADVYSAASLVLEKSGHAALVHHAGHGLGLGHPEPPILVPESTDVLLAGDVVTLEPGLYVAGIGGVRLEHNYVIREDGARRLSNHALTLQ